ncbi:MAG: 7-carboxy-7-deazaguanine synthase QueE [Planctomycetales bacterium]
MVREPVPPPTIPIVPATQGTSLLRCAEIFHSIQGEGSLMGTESVFVRTTGCNLRCWFCDTPYTSWEPEGEQLSSREVLDRVLKFGSRHVVLTGGEPLLQPALIPLSVALREQKQHVTVETAGTVYRPVAADLMSISPKLSNSTPEESRSLKWSRRHAQQRENRNVVTRLMAEYLYQLKFVVEQPEDLPEILTYLEAFPQVTAERVWLMPEARTQQEHADKRAWLEPLAASHGFRFAHGCTSNCGETCGEVARFLQRERREGTTLPPAIADS